MRLLQIELPEATFQAIERAANATGQSIESIVSDQLSADFVSPSNLDHVFTPEVLDEIESAIEESDRLGSAPVDAVFAKLLEKGRTWKGSPED